MYKELFSIDRMGIFVDLDERDWDLSYLEILKGFMTIQELCYQFIFCAYILIQHYVEENHDKILSFIEEVMKGAKQ